MKAFAFLPYKKTSSIYFLNFVGLLKDYMVPDESNGVFVDLRVNGKIGSRAVPMLMYGQLYNVEALKSKTENCYQKLVDCGYAPHTIQHKYSEAFKEFVKESYLRTDLDRIIQERMSIYPVVDNGNEFNTIVADFFETNYSISLNRPMINLYLMRYLNLLDSFRMELVPWYDKRNAGIAETIKADFRKATRLAIYQYRKIQYASKLIDVFSIDDIPRDLLEREDYLKSSKELVFIRYPSGVDQEDYIVYGNTKTADTALRSIVKKDEETLDSYFNAVGIPCYIHNIFTGKEYQRSLLFKNVDGNYVNLDRFALHFKRLAKMTENEIRDEATKYHSL